jgi:hypothetical protein
MLHDLSGEIAVFLGKDKRICCEKDFNQKNR